jgi:hypothetical protein
LILVVMLEIFQSCRVWVFWLLMSLNHSDNLQSE